MQITLKVNGQSRSIDADPDMPLLWALRDFLGLKGAKYGCGIGACGACTVQVNGRAMRACVVPLKSVMGLEIRSIEGLGGHDAHALEVHAELVGDDHGVAGVRALPHLGGRRVQPHLTVRGDLEVGVHESGRGLRPGGRVGTQRQRHRHGEGPRTEHEVASREHGQPSAFGAMAWAARCTAASMRG